MFIAPKLVESRQQITCHMFRDLADKPEEVLKQTPQHPGIADSKKVKSWDKPIPGVINHLKRSNKVYVLPWATKQKVYENTALLKDKT